MFSIDNMKLEDLESVIEIHNEAFNTGTEKSTVNEEKFTALSKDTTYRFLVARDSETDKVVGFVQFHLLSDFFEDCTNYATVSSVCVSKSYRNKGVAKLLMQKIESIAEELGCCYILFTTELNNTNAKKLYKSLGYKLEKGYEVLKYLR